MENWTLYLIAGIIVVTISLLRYNIKRRRREAEETARRRAALQAAREAETKRQREMGQAVKIKPGSLRSNQVDRIPMSDPVETTFAGSETPRNLARWETEIHEIGRQITGRIDSKMVALQTLTIEANRAANRLELLLERFEQLTKAQNPVKPIADEHETEPETLLEVMPTATPEVAVDPEPVVPAPNVLRSTELNSDAEAFTDILNDLESEIEELEQYQEPEPAASVTVLKVEKTKENRAEEYRKILDPVPQDRSGGDVLSLRSPGLPGGSSSETSAGTVLNGMPRKQGELRSSLSFESLYDDTLTSREGADLFAVASPAGGSGFSAVSPSSESDRSRSLSPPPSPRRSVEGSRLDLRKQVEMMADYGNTPRQIAQTLNITVGEVDLMLSLRD